MLFCCQKSILSILSWSSSGISVKYKVLFTLETSNHKQLILLFISDLQTLKFLSFLNFHVKNSSNNINKILLHLCNLISMSS